MYLRIITLFLFALKVYAFYSGNKAIVNLNSDNFNKLVKNSREVWLVEFFAPWCGHCHSFAREYEKTARALNGVIKVGAVNADENPALLQEHGVEGYPTIKIFNAEKGIAKDYNGDHKASELVSFVVNLLQDRVKTRLNNGGNIGKATFKHKHVKELTDRNFDEIVLASKESWLVVFYSPSCGSCKKLAKQWSQVVKDLKDMVKLGAIDCTAHNSKASNYEITDHPSILFFPSGKKKASSAVKYTGKHTSNDIIEWTIDELAETAPPPEITEITNFNTLKSACENKHICILSFLPHISECRAKCRNEYLDMLRNANHDFKKWLWGWVWVEAYAQDQLEDALGVGESYPTMVAVDIEKMRYSVLTGAFSTDGMYEFLMDLSDGKGVTKPITVKEMPSIYILEPWDGKDADDEEVSTSTEKSFEEEKFLDAFEQDEFPPSEGFKDEL